MSSGGGGGPGSAAVPPISGATQFQNQFQPTADASAMSGIQQIANNSFYPMPQVSSFLFPAGVPGLIAPQNQYQVQTSPGTPGTGGGGATAGTGAGFSTIAAGEGPFGGPSNWYGAPSTQAQLAGDIFGSVQAGGEFAGTPTYDWGGGAGPTGQGFPQSGANPINPQEMMQMQQIASGQIQNPYISQAMASQYLQGNYSVADQLAPQMPAIMQAETQQSAQGSLAGPQQVTPGAGYGAGGAGTGGTAPTYGTVQGPLPPQIGSQLNPMLAGFLGGPQGALSDLEAGFGNQMGGWTGVQQAFGPGNADFLNNLMAAASPQGAAPVGPGPTPGAGMAGQGGAGGVGGVSQLGGGFGPTGVGGGVGPGQAPIPNPQGAQSAPGAAFTTSPQSGAVTSPTQVGTGGYSNLNTNNPLAPNFTSPGTGGTGQGALGSGQSFSYPGAAAFLGMGPQIAASGMDVPPILQGAAGAILNAGFDPENALRAQTANQTQQATNANLSASGLAATPYGASVLGNTMGNFGLNWNDRQLARETQAGTAAAGMAGEAQTLQQQALNALQGGAMGATAQSQQSIQDFLSYLGQATGQNQVNVNAYKAMADAANQAQSNKQQASQAGKSGLTGGLGTAGSLLGGLLA